jgi:nitrile hydratase subunit beta
MQGFGPVIPEPGEPVFHANWERRVFGIAAAISVGLGRNTDAFRHAIERMEPGRYLATSYYEHWLHAIETRLLEAGLITRAELGEACIVPDSIPGPRRSTDSAPARERPRQRARFKPGDKVIARNLNPAGHTRLPRYARGKPGVIVRDLGVFTFPDTNAHGIGRNPQHCYTVCFKARNLWGSSANARDSVYIDLWEDYIAAAVPRARARARRRKR